MMGIRGCCGILVLFVLPWKLLCLPEFNKLENWAQKLDTDIKNYLDEVTGIRDLQQAYNKNRDVNVLPVDGEDLINKMAEKLGYGILGPKQEALERLVLFAEKAAAKHKYDPTYQIGNVSYEASKELNHSDPSLRYDEVFNQRVSKEYSTVHIPVEIYNGGIDILNGLKWSGALDEQFQNNLSNDSDLLWQYFGSQLGYIRSFPGTAWYQTSAVDLYDVRRRPWYTQGSSSPKDMMILIDTSGSMHGIGLELMRITVKVLLDTLGENDFVTVANFSNGGTYTSCLKTFVQANHKNKELFSNAVDQIKANGMAHYSKGLEFAFKEFEKFDKQSRNDSGGRGATCNRIIMLLTDGGADDATDVIQKYNADKKIRIFTYAIGQAASPTDAIKKYACENRGYYSEIPAMGAVRSKVQDHVGILSRPLALNDMRYYRWSNIYSDALSLRTGGQSGLGMMTTLTLPVYNKSAGSSNQTILGVMGIDVTIRDMEAETPRKELGLSGYTFSINANGYIVFHPNLKGQHGYLSDPPNVDLLEVEWDNGNVKEQIRKNMIDNITGTETVKTKVMYQDERYIREENRTYIYRGIPNTNFSLGMVIPEQAKRYLKVSVDDSKIENGLKALVESNITARILAPWHYCNKTKKLIENNIDDVVAQIRGDLNNDNCDSSLKQYLLWDALSTEILDTVWKQAQTDGVDSRLVTTVYGGLTKIFPANASESYGHLSLQQPWSNSLYQLADSVEGYHFRAPYNTLPKMIPNVTVIETIHSVTVVKAIKYLDTSITTAVLSAQITADRLQQFVVNTTWSSDSLCQDTESVYCFLLDEGAFIISTNQETTNVGRFLGRVDLDLMNALFNNSVYMKSFWYDHQATCLPAEEIVSAGPRLFVPTLPYLYELLNIQSWWTSGVTWAYLNFNLYNWLFSSSDNYVSAETSSESVAKNTSCINETFQYSYGLDSSTFSGSWFCDSDCSRSFTTFRSKHSNLLIVIADKPCDACMQYQTRLPQEPQRSTGPDMCVAEHRYRRRPEPCFDFDEREDPSDCGAGFQIIPSVTTLLLTLLVWFLFVR